MVCVRGEYELVGLGLSLTVEDYGDFLAVPGCEDVVEEGGFASS